MIGETVIDGEEAAGMPTAVADFDEHSISFTVIPLRCEHRSGDFRTLADLEAVLSHAIDDEHAVLLVDLSGTTGIGCGLINVLLRCSERAAQKECDLVLCGLSSLQLTVLKVMRLDVYWSIYPSCERAIESMQRQALGSHTRLSSSVLTD